MQAYTVNLVHNGHQRGKQHMVFIDMWPEVGGYIVLFNQGLLKCDLYLQGGLYSEVAGLTVYICLHICYNLV